MRTRYFCNALCQHPLDTGEHECWEPLGFCLSPSCTHNLHHVLLLHSKRAQWAHQARTCHLTSKIYRNEKPFSSVWPQQSAPDVQPGIHVVLGAFPASLSGLLLQACASVSPWHPMCVGSAGVCGQWGVWAAVCSQAEAAAPWLRNKSAWQGQECKHRRSQGTSEAVIQGVSRSAVGMGGERGAEGGGEERGELAGLFEYQALPHSRLRWQLHYLHI